MTDNQAQAKQPKTYKYKERDPNYKGEPCDKELANGPTEKRTIRDIFCCLLFIAYCVGMVIVSIIGLANGNPQLLVDPYDTNGTAFTIISQLHNKTFFRKSMRPR